MVKKKEGEGHSQGKVQGGQGQDQGHCNQGYQRGAGATTYVYPEAQWLAERPSGGEGLVRGRGRCSITISYDCTNGGGSVLCHWWCTLLVSVAEAKREIGANCQEV